MGLKVSYVQQNYQAANSLALKTAARDVLANAQAKSTIENNTAEMELYYSQIDAAIAKRFSESGAGLQVTLNNNLKTAIKYLKSKVSNEEPAKSADVIAIEAVKKDKHGSNPFYNGDVANHKKKDEEESKKETSEYLFIKAA